MGNRNWLQPLTGVLFILLGVAMFFVLGDEPPDAANDPLQEVLDFYTDNEDEVMISAFIQGLAAGVLVFFGAYLFKRLRASGAEATAAVAFAGTIIIAVGFAVDATVNISLAELVNGDEADAPGAVQALSTLWNNDFIPLGAGVFVYLMGVGVGIVRHGALPAWMGWVAIVGAVTMFTPAFFVALIVALLFTLVSSIMFSREESSGGSASAAPAA